MFFWITLLNALATNAVALTHSLRPRLRRTNGSPVATFKKKWLRSFKDSNDSVLFDLPRDDIEIEDYRLSLAANIAERGVVPFPKAKNYTVEAAADAWFHLIKPRRVTKQMMDEIMSIDNKSCGTIQVIDNKIYTQNKLLSKSFYNSRMFDLAWLMQHARKRYTLPNVDIMLCTSDAGDTPLKSSPHFGKVPVLTPVSRLTNAGTIPVPMLARSDKSFWGNPAVQSLISGKRIFRRVNWKQKIHKAFFRGHLHEGCGDMDEKTPSPRSHCFRNYIVHKLADLPECNVSGEFVPEAEFENYMVLLVLGNLGGWADRTMQTLFKSSAALYIDQSAYDWFMPLLDDRVHYIRAEPDIDDVREKVRWALEHSDEMENITKTANRHASYLFNTDSLTKYLYLVLLRYADSLDYVPTLRKGMDKF